MPLKYIPVLNLLEPRNGRAFGLWLLIGLLLFAMLWVGNHYQHSNQLQMIQKKGRLVVLTRNAPTAVYEDNNESSGFEYELLASFARELGVELVLRFETDIGTSAALLAGHSVDIIAAGRNNYDYHNASLRHTAAYAQSKVQVLYKNGVSKRPKEVANLEGQNLGIADGLGYNQLLNDLKAKHPKLEWQVFNDANGADIMDMIDKQELTYALADSREVALNQRYTPEVHVGFDLTDDMDISWKIAQSDDDSLYNAINQFFKKNHTQELLLTLNEQYFGHIASFDYVNKRAFLENVRERLPLYKYAFIAEGDKLGLDWRLLAAIGYQESHWNPNATSPTGVRGLMMLTQNTAAQMQVSDRLDPLQSIRGGSEYFQRMKKNLPDEITEPDRTYLALAAYNIGYGHLRDAQQLTKERGENPNLWVHVKAVLPLLRSKKYHQHLQHGFARGDEAVQYVSNVRDYYETLVWLETSSEPPPISAPAKVEMPTPFAL